MSKILLLTNDLTLKKYIDGTFKHNGFVVHTAASSEEGWKFLKEIRFDFIMVDFVLKNESGLAFYKSLRQFGASIPVLMIGEGPFDEFMLKDYSYENYDFIIKPFKFETLKVRMNYLIQMNLESEQLLTYGVFKIDVRQQLVIVKDKIIQLGKMEMKIMVLLARKAGGVVDLSNITTFYYVVKLRKKLKRIAGEAFELSLIQNQGHRLIVNA